MTIPNIFFVPIKYFAKTIIIYTLQPMESKEVVKEVSAYLKKNERSLRWLSKKTKIPYGTLYSCVVRGDFNLSEKNIKKINESLDLMYPIK